MKIEHLAYFTEMKGAKSLSEAAERAHISQQGYGKVISSLEKTLNCKLVNRDARGAELTDQGKLFLHHAETIVNEYDKALTNLQTQQADLSLLSVFDGNLVFSDVCMSSFETLFSENDLLQRSSKREQPLNEALELAEDPDWICVCDVSPQIYPDYAERWSIDPLAIGRVGLVAPQNMLESTGFTRVIDIASHIPIGLFDCYATREIYAAIFGTEEFGHIKMRTTSDRLLKDGLLRGDFAILADSYHWEEYPPSLKTGSNPLVFVPFEKEMHSIFGFVRARGVPYSPEQRAVVDAMKRVFEQVRPSAAWS